MRYTADDASRLTSKIRQPDQPGGCYEWMASRSGSNGYGQFRLAGRMHPAHRVLWVMTYGPIPEGSEVCHSCDNPLCMTPDHLWLGTHAQNMRDARTKGRLLNQSERGITITRHCHFCGDEFTGPMQKYHCSDRCRYRTKNARLRR